MIQKIKSYNWSKSIFTAIKFSGFIGDTSLSGLDFSFCEQKRYIVLKVSDNGERTILDFLRENYLTIDFIKDSPDIPKKTPAKICRNLFNV
jgi:hypothetical protein